jgi:hypothetical protein
VGVELIGYYESWLEEIGESRVHDRVCVYANDGNCQDWWKRVEVSDNFPRNDDNEEAAKLNRDVALRAL